MKEVGSPGELLISLLHIAEDVSVWGGRVPAFCQERFNVYLVDLLVFCCKTFTEVRESTVAFLLRDQHKPPGNEIPQMNTPFEKSLTLGGSLQSIFWMSLSELMSHCWEPAESSAIALAKARVSKIEESTSVPLTSESR